MPQPEGDLVTLSTVGIVPGTYTIKAQVWHRVNEIDVN